MVFLQFRMAQLFLKEEAENIFRIVSGVQQNPESAPIETPPAH